MSEATPSLQLSTAITADNHGAEIVVAAVLCLTASVLSMVTRLSIRWPWQSLLGLDDVVCAIAMLFSIAQTAVILGGVSQGFGRKAEILQVHEITEIEKMVYSSNLLLVVALCLGKLAVATLFSRLSSMRASKFLMAVSVAYGVAGIFVIALGRPISRPWDVLGASPGSTLARWASIEAIGMLIDVALIVYPIFILRRLKMDRGTKVAVMMGFALRFPVIVLSALRLTSLATMDWSDFTYSYTYAEIFAQAEMHYNTIAATIPCLRIFLRGWQTGFLGTALKEMDPDEYTRHSSIPKSPRTPHSSSNKSHRLSWKRRQRDMSEIFDGGVHGPETSISSHRESAYRSVSRESEASITVERTIDIQPA